LDPAVQSELLVRPQDTVTNKFNSGDHVTDVHTPGVLGTLGRFAMVQVLASLLVMMRWTVPFGKVELVATATNLPSDGDQATDCQAAPPAAVCVVHFTAELLTPAA
jgi:hypothetical protein